MAFLISMNYNSLSLYIYIYTHTHTHYILHFGRRQNCCIHFPVHFSPLRILRNSAKITLTDLTKSCAQYFLLMYLCWRRIQMGILLFKETDLSWTLAQQASEQIDVLCQPSGDYVRIGGLNPSFRYSILVPFKRQISKARTLKKQDTNWKLDYNSREVFWFLVYLSFLRNSLKYCVS